MEQRLENTGRTLIFCHLLWSSLLWANWPEVEDIVSSVVLLPDKHVSSIGDCPITQYCLQCTHTCYAEKNYGLQRIIGSKLVPFQRNLQPNGSNMIKWASCHLFEDILRISYQFLWVFILCTPDCDLVEWLPTSSRQFILPSFESWMKAEYFLPLEITFEMTLFKFSSCIEILVFRSLIQLTIRI